MHKPIKKKVVGQDHTNGVAPDLARAEAAVAELLTALRIDWQDDPNMRDTPRRVAKMYASELFIGRYEPPPDITAFDTEFKHNDLQMIGPITLKSTCAHHLMPIIGVAYIGILPTPGAALPGLSKSARIVNWFARRPTIQEDLVEQIANYLFAHLQPQGLGVRIIASHGCCSLRGINDTNMRFVTTALRGDMFTSRDLKQEFLQECYHVQTSMMMS